MNASCPPRLLLVDGSSYLYRAFHAMPDLRAVPGDPSSAPTGALRGMVNMLKALHRDWPASHRVCVFDASGPTFRDALYPAYKAQRAPMPPELRAQIEPIHRLVHLLGWPLLAVPGVEADDVLGTLALHGAQAGFEVVISSGDKDLSQLVNPQVMVVDTMNGKRRDVAGVLAEFGVPPAQMRDYQALVGDAVDNVPGVPKVGPKTAAKWLGQYGTLSALMAQAQDVGGAVGASLRASLDWLPTAQALVTIRTDVDLSAWVAGWPAIDSLAANAEQTGDLADFYQCYGFRGLARGLSTSGAPARAAGDADGASASRRAEPVAGAAAADGDQGRVAVASDGDAIRAGEAAALSAGTAQAAVAQVAQVVPAEDYRTLCTLADLQDWLVRVRAAPLVALDTETTGLHALGARLVGLSMAVAPGCAAYLPLAHADPDGPAQLALDQALAVLGPWLEDAQAPKVLQNAKFDTHVLANHGLSLRGVAHDTLLQSYVLEGHLSHALDALAERHLGLKGLSYEDLCGKGAQQIGFDQVPIARASRYACEDADFTLRVHQVLGPRVQADAGLTAVYALELQVSDVLVALERQGVLIDAAQLAAQSQALGERIVALEQEAYHLAGQPFNLNSPKQISEIFFNQLGLPVIKRTPTGSPSTDEGVLEQLAQDFPLPARILEHRGLAKLKSTYTDKLPSMIWPASGRVHTHYAQAVAVTGRLASSEPNLQNIPVRTPEGRRVREAFVAPPGWQIASADYSQIELRIMAHLSGDTALLMAFHDGMDVHRATAAEVFGLDTAQVSAEQRRAAKAINFGLIYGMGEFGLARQLGIEVSAARAYIARYFDRYPGVLDFMERTRRQAAERGWVQTVMGRRLVVPDIRAGNAARRKAAERAAINAPMQGTAADLIKLAMVAVQNALHMQGRATRMVMQVHDELVFEVPPDEADWVRQQVPRLMAGVAQLKVPLLAEVGLGPNWEQAH